MLPGMEDRPEELRRQREFVAAHLRWLDEVIARTEARDRPATIPAPRESAAPVAVPPPLPAAAQPASAEPVLPEIDPGSIRNEIRRGCLIYAIGAAVLLAASVAVAVWIAGV